MTLAARTALALVLLAPAWQPATTAAQDAGRQPFAGYNPGRCAVAARMIDGLHRHDRRDTTVFSPARDTLFTATTDSLRACERAYGGSTSEAVEVLNLARVQLFTGQDEAAAATQRRHMEAVAGRPGEERAWELWLIVQDNLDGKPARLEPARAALAELDALGEAAASVRTAAHYAMMVEAIRRYDDEWMRQEMAAVLKAWRELDEETRLWRAEILASAFLGRAGVEVLAHGGEAALAVVDSARGIIPVQARFARQRIEAARRLYANMGRDAAPLDAQFWYNTGVTGTARPAPGRVSVILPAYRPCTAGCLSMMDAARRIAARFQGQDLDITFRTQTFGFYADTAPATPLAEAQYDSAYFLHHVRIPGALAIADTKFSFHQDGRRLNEPTTDQLNYPEAAVVVVDRKGVIRYVAGAWNPVLEARITGLIERLLQETADTTGAAGAAPDPAGPPARPDGPPDGGWGGDAAEHATAAHGRTQQRRTGRARARPAHRDGSGKENGT